MNAHVRDAAELFEEVSREEGEDCVLGRDDLVSSIEVIFLDPVFVVIIIVWEGLVDEDGARGSRRTNAGEDVLDAPACEAVVPCPESLLFRGHGGGGGRDDEREESASAVCGRAAGSQALG